VAVECRAARLFFAQGMAHWAGKHERQVCVYVCIRMYVCVCVCVCMYGLENMRDRCEACLSQQASHLN
jgi:hypothetical protein